jgi:outer membrane lipoprotein
MEQTTKEKTMLATGWRSYSLCGLVGIMALLGMGCAHAISESLRAQAEPSVPFAQLRANPEAYKEQTVILGGEILSTENLQQGTRLEVLQKSLDHSEAPMRTDDTGGRFMALCSDYLDPAVYSQGRRVTVAGRVLGSYTGKIGEVVYVYPLIACQEVHLWPRTVAVAPSHYYGWDWPRYPYILWRPYARWPYYRYW